MRLTSSFYLSGQRTCDFLPGLLALATVVAQFYTPSPREFGQMKNTRPSWSAHELKSPNRCGQLRDRHGARQKDTPPW